MRKSTGASKMVRYVETAAEVAAGFRLWLERQAIQISHDQDAYLVRLKKNFDCAMEWAEGPAQDAALLGFFREFFPRLSDVDAEENLVALAKRCLDQLTQRLLTNVYRSNSSSMFHNAQQAARAAAAAHLRNEVQSFLTRYGVASKAVTLAVQ